MHGANRDLRGSRRFNTCFRLSALEISARETARSYVDRTGLKLDLRQVEKIVRGQTLHSAAIADAVGFVFGGGKRQVLLPFGSGFLLFRSTSLI